MMVLMSDASTDVHFHPWGAYTACGQAAMVEMSLTIHEDDVTCAACRATFEHVIR